MLSSLRFSFSELRRDKAMRFDSMILELQTEIRSKNSMIKDTWRQFEAAVAAYEKISSASTDILESVDDDQDLDEDEDIVGAMTPREASHGISPEVDRLEHDDYEDQFSMQDMDENSYLYDAAPPKQNDDGVYNNYVDKTLISRSRSHTTDGGGSPNATLPLASNTYSAPITATSIVTIPEKKPRPSIGNERASLSSIASSKALADSGPKRKAHTKCKRLQQLLKNLETSLAESQFKLVFTREDYQRSLQALDDLEEELCAISTRFEENQKKSLGHFFNTLQDKQDQSIIEVYKDLKEYKGYQGVKRKHRLDEDEVSLLAVGPSKEEDVVTKKPRTNNLKPSGGGRRIIKTFLAFSTVTALAAATGIATGYLPSSF
ncbi:hypothetical protein NQZ79_g6642 [Umbelopsis isabellina]|nr:hypothetical protein NQZ79_g6642 [Umbelopsis isabellina]